MVASTGSYFTKIGCAGKAVVAGLFDQAANAVETFGRFAQIAAAALAVIAATRATGRDVFAVAIDATVGCAIALIVATLDGGAFAGRLKVQAAIALSDATLVATAWIVFQN